VAREEKKRARRCDRKNEDEGDWNWFEELCVANSDTFRIVSLLWAGLCKSYQEADAKKEQLTTEVIRHWFCELLKEPQLQNR
jgi:hypothetical protein